MSRTLRLDQVFYGTSPSGYGILGTSLTDKSVAQSAINVCLAVGQNPGSGLAKPILLSRVVGDRIVMARLCNGGKDSSGRNSIFVHAFVASVQEARSTYITTFSLEDDGVFCNRMPDSPSMPVIVESRPLPEVLSSVPLELPAAIETSEPDTVLMRRIVAGRENELSWSTFAFDDMPGYDIICISPLAIRPDARAIYDAGLRRVRGAIVQWNAPTPVSPPHVEKFSCQPQRNPIPEKEDARKGKNGLLIPFLISIVVNVILLAVFVLTREKDTAQVPGISSKSQFDEIVGVAKRKFTDENAVKDLGPIQNLLNEDNSHKEDEKEVEQRELLKKLLAYKNFVEEFILNQN